ncbi:hypothetical protein CYMTET_54500 [Cymbomonas tetramitiformis]|uniref:JmjC domain-containing protein n=1 Tax=Cymbomonas tetramitiformis TaxID=36881 RepID=A0AAE0BFY8_9CHLO|nr:hypothetical protein CYMTET_54500 [Cymbomonas tetramitiformis]
MSPGAHSTVSAAGMSPEAHPLAALPACLQRHIHDRVPPGVNVFVDLEDGDMGVQTPNSLTWFLEVYPNIPPHERPIECVQRPGETIFVPSGWWHCVLNLSLTVAVTQNFVSQANMMSVCRDMRGFNQYLRPAGWQPDEEAQRDSASASPTVLAGAEDYRELRTWLRALWLEKPHLREDAWRCACEVTDAELWLQRATRVCSLHSIAAPSGVQEFALGSGSTGTVFVTNYHVLKFYHGPVAGVVQPPPDLAWAALSAEDPEEGEEGLGFDLEQGVLRGIESLGGARIKAAAPRLVSTGILEEESVAESPDAKHSQAKGTATDRMPPVANQLPYLITTRSKGGNMRECWRQLKGDAATARKVLTQLAVILEDLHALPTACIQGRGPNRGAGAGSGPGRGPNRGAGAGSGPGLVSASMTGTELATNEPIRPIGAERAMRTSASATETGGTHCEHPTGSRDDLWEPFINFLQEQHVEAHERQVDSAQLPPRLLNQLEGYLSDSLRALAPSKASAAAPLHESADPQLPRHPPRSLHGDLTVENVIVELWPPMGPQEHASAATVHGKIEEHSPPRVTLIDFGDARCGDPLYDLVMLHVAILKSNTHLLRTVVRAYVHAKRTRAHSDTATPAPATNGRQAHDSAAAFDEAEMADLDGRFVAMGCGMAGPAVHPEAGPVQGASGSDAVEGIVVQSGATGEIPETTSQPATTMRPSQRAMCYTLLHEQDVLTHVFKAQPDWRTVSTLEELAQKMWGILDTEWED